MALVDDALALWLCDEGSGNTLVDSTVNGYNGTLNAQAGWGSVASESGLDIRASNANVDFGSVPIYGQDISVMFRIYATALPSSATDIIDLYLTTSNQRSWRIQLNSDGRLFAQLSQDGTAFVSRTNYGSVSLTAGVWTNYVVTFDGDGGTGMNVIVYKDDAANAGDSTPSGVGSLFASTAPFFVGTGRSGGTSNVYLRNIVLLTSVATAQQITDHHNEDFGIGTDKTATVQLADINGNNRANQTGLAWGWYDQLPQTGVSPTDSGGNASTDANGSLTVTIANSTLAQGQTGYLGVSSSIQGWHGIYPVVVS